MVAEPSSDQKTCTRGVSLPHEKGIFNVPLGWTRDERPFKSWTRTHGEQREAGKEEQLDAGATDTVAPRGIARAFDLKETATAKNIIGSMAANEIKNYGTGG